MRLSNFLEAVNCKVLPSEIKPILNLAKNSGVLEDPKICDPNLMRTVAILSLDMDVEKFYSIKKVKEVKRFQAGGSFHPLWILLQVAFQFRFHP